MSIAYQRASRGPVAGRPAGDVVVISGTSGDQGQAGEHELHGPLPDLAEHRAELSRLLRIRRIAVVRHRGILPPTAERTDQVDAGA